MLVRPAVEAGERLGFLPGDMAQKVDPYLRPLYDALYDLMGYDKVAKMFERGAIEIAPLAFMRGRTLNHSFVILDEAQNTTPEQMKMFLTRIGFGSKAVVTGDVTQIDLANGQKSGLIDAQEVLKNVRGIAFTHFGTEDVVRHPLVQRIVNAYENREARSRARARTKQPERARRGSRARSPCSTRRARAVVPSARTFGSGRARRCDGDARITVRLVGLAEGRALNRDYRGRDYATNVLTFVLDDGPPYAGDLALCAPVVSREAREQGKDADGALRAPDRARRAAPAGLRPRARARRQSRWKSSKRGY